MPNFIRRFTFLMILVTSAAVWAPQMAQAGLIIPTTTLVNAGDGLVGGFVFNQPDLSEHLSDQPANGASTPLGFLPPASGAVPGYDGSLDSLMSGTNLLSYVAGAQQDAAAAQRFGLDGWVRGGWAQRTVGTRTQNLGNAHVGAEFFVNPDLILGVLGEWDWADESNIMTATGTVSSHGWLVGPYVVARLHENVIFDAQVDYGQSANTTSPLGTWVNNFNASRLFIRSQLTGDYSFDLVTITPQLTLNYLRENQDAYTDPFFGVVPAQTIEKGQLLFGTDVSAEIAASDDFVLMPSLGVRGVWNFVDTSSTPYAQLTARLDAGLSVAVGAAVNVKLEGFYEGLGTGNYHAAGGSIKLLGRL